MDQHEVRCWKCTKPMHSKSMCLNGHNVCNNCTVCRICHRSSVLDFKERMTEELDKNSRESKGLWVEVDKKSLELKERMLVGIDAMIRGTFKEPDFEKVRNEKAAKAEDSDLDSSEEYEAEELEKEEQVEAEQQIIIEEIVEYDEDSDELVEEFKERILVDVEARIRGTFKESDFEKVRKEKAVEVEQQNLELSYDSSEISQDLDTTAEESELDSSEEYEAEKIEKKEQVEVEQQLLDNAEGIDEYEVDSGALVEEPIIPGPNSQYKIEQSRKEELVEVEHHRISPATNVIEYNKEQSKLKKPKTSKQPRSETTKLSKTNLDAMTQPFTVKCLKCTTFVPLPWKCQNSHTICGNCVVCSTCQFSLLEEIRSDARELNRMCRELLESTFPLEVANPDQQKRKTGIVTEEESDITEEGSVILGRQSDTEKLKCEETTKAEMPNLGSLHRTEEKVIEVEQSLLVSVQSENSCELS